MTSLLWVVVNHIPVNLSIVHKILKSTDIFHIIVYVISKILKLCLDVIFFVEFLRIISNGVTTSSYLRRCQIKTPQNEGIVESLNTTQLISERR